MSPPEDALVVPESSSPNAPLLDDQPSVLPDDTPQQGTPRARRQARRPIAPAPETAGAAFVASQRDPQRHAKVVELADRLNLSPAFVEQNYDDLAKAADQHTTQFEMDSVSPTLRNWLSDTDNASIAKHEIAPLAQVDRGSKLLTPPSPIEEPGALDALGTATATGMSDLALSTHLLAAAFGHTTPAKAAADIAAAKVRSNSLRDQAPAYAKEYASAVNTAQGDLDRARDLFLSGNGEKRKAGILNSLVNFAASEAAGQVPDPTAALTLGETLSLIASHVAGWNRLKGFAYQNIESLASMLPILGAGKVGAVGGAAVGSVVPVLGTAAGGAVGGLAGTFAGASAVGIASEIEQEMAAHGVDLADAGQVERALSNASLMQTIRDKALRSGITSAGVMTLFTALGAKLGTAEEGASTAARAGAKAAAIAAPAVGVAAGQEAGAAAAGEPVSPSRAISTTLQMLAFGAGTEALGESRRALFHPETAEAAAQATTQAEDALRAQHDAQVMTEVGRAVKEAGTTASVPDRLKSLIETATGGQDAATVYFQPGEWDRYWQDQGASPAKAAADIMGDDGKAYHDATATGARIAIPLSDYIAKVAPTDHFEGLLDVARTRPDGMSFREAQEYLQSLPATMKELSDEAVAQSKGEPSPLEQSAKQVRQDVEDQLLKAGISPTAAKAQAELYESAFRTLGARANVSARELFNRYGLTIGRGPLELTPEATAKIEAAKKAAEAAGTQEATLKTAAAALETQAKSGEPAIAETAKGRAKFIAGITPSFSDEAEAARLEEQEGAPRAAELARPRTASGRLKNLAKATPEELANEYKLLVDANAQENIAPTAIETGHGETWTGMKPGAMKAAGRVAARAKTIAKLEEEFARRGMDPGEAYMAAHRNAANQEPTGFEFNQSAVPSNVTDTPEFKRWFGESKVVDASGKPLIVYHGTTEVFDRFTKNRAGLRYGEDYGYSGKGHGVFFFTDNARVASDYAEPSSVHPLDSPNVLPVYLALKKPLVIDGQGRGWGVFRDDIAAARGGREYDGVIVRNVADHAKADTAQDVGGIDVYVAFEPNQIKSATGNSGTFDVRDKSILHQPARGKITFGDGRDFHIALLKNADRSTFLHETGHFYLEVLGDLAKAPSATEDLKADYQTIRDWVGAEGDKPFTVEQHEQFARGFEAYLMEGKAPSADLRTAFFRFKNWLLNIYRNLRSLNVELTPEVRGVFDRMLASQDEIRQAEAEENVGPLFDDPRALGMNDEQAASYARAVSEAHESAETELTTQLMKQVRREESAQWKTWRDPIEAEVTKDVNERPVYKAIEYMARHQNTDGSPLPENSPEVKLNRDAVKQLYGDDAVKGLPRKVLTSDGGVHPDVAAEMFGFNDGRALVDAMRQAPSRTAAIKAETDARMQDEHGTRLTDVAVRELATQTLHSEKRVALLRKELEYLASEHLAQLKGLVRTIAKAVPPSEEVERQARDVVGAKTVRELRPDLFAKAATRASVEARDALLKGDIDGAFEAKRKELLATEVYREAAAQKDGVDKALDRFKDVFRPDARVAELRDMNLVNAARSVLASFGIGRSDKAPASYLKQMESYDPEAYQEVRAMVEAATDGAKDYKDMSVDDFNQMKETVDGLWQKARRDKQMLIDGQRIERKQAETDLTTHLSDLDRKPDKAGYEKAVDRWDRSKRTLLTTESWLRRVEHWVDAMDKGDFNGPFRKYIYNPISEGSVAYRVARREMINKYIDIVAPLKGKMDGENFFAPELGYTFKNKAEILGALLHSGNGYEPGSNGYKLLVGRHWGDVMENGVVDTSRWRATIARWQREGVIEQAHYDFLQGIWNLFEGQKPDAQRAHFDMFGRYFPEVTKVGFDTPFGHYDGGYYPAKVDPFMVRDIAIHQEREDLLGSGNGFMFPSTGKGFTMQRVDGYAKPLLIDADYVTNALADVLRFTHIQPRVRDVARLITGGVLRPELEKWDPTIGSTMLVPWLQRAAMQRISQPSAFKPFDDFMGAMRQRAGVQIMAGSLSTALQMVGHFPGALTRIKAGTAASSLWDYMHNPTEFAGDIAEKSDYMATRETNGVTEMERVAYHLIQNAGAIEKMTDFTKQHGYFLTHAVQNVIDMVVWKSAYSEAIEGGAGEKESVKRADSIVRETQGSFAPEDVSRFEAGNALVRAFSQFYSFFNVKANMLSTEFQKTVRTMGLRKGAGRLLWVYTTGFLAPAIMWGLVRQGTSGQSFKHEDEDSYMPVLLRLFFGSQFHMATSMVPIVGPAVQTAVDQLQGKHTDDLISSPAVNAMSTAARAVTVDPYHAIKDRIVTTREIKDVLTFIGLLTGTPAGALGKPLGYLHDVSTGRAEPTGVVDFTRGLATGQPGGR